MFSKTHFRQLPLALELSAESLPSMIAAMPDLKTAIRNPASILSSMISQVERRLSEASSEQATGPRVYILTGETGEGKTTLLRKLTAELKEKGIRAGGILAPRLMEGNITSGYDVLDIRSGISAPFLRLTNAEILGVERFTQIEEGYQAGLKALDPDNNRESDVIVIDEAGPLEMRGEGWAGRISGLLIISDWQIILVVRKSLVDGMSRKFGINDPVVYGTGPDDYSRLLNQIINAAENG
jgi:nucleoside-triphosphatase THEP1